MMNQIGINSTFDCLFDRQQDNPVGFCPVCGREIYNRQDDLCIWCIEDLQ